MEASETTDYYCPGDPELENLTPTSACLAGRANMATHGPHKVNYTKLLCETVGTTSLVTTLDIASPCLLIMIEEDKEMVKESVETVGADHEVHGTETSKVGVDTLDHFVEKPVWNDIKEPSVVGNAPIAG